MSTEFSKAEDTSQPHEMQSTLPNTFTGHPAGKIVLER